MAISKKALQAITDAKGGAASFKAVLAALAEDQSITKDVAGIVGLALDHANADGALDKAIAANHGAAATPAATPAAAPVAKAGT
jgi:hypothetical protein